MKKLILVFGLGGFFSASAQQQELFDISKHLRNKNTNNPILKKIPSLPYQPSSPDLDPLIGFKTQPLIQFYNVNAEKVVPFYNIPCVKPDMNLFKLMPNPGLLTFPSKQLPHNLLPGDIPNAAWPRNHLVRK